MWFIPALIAAVASVYAGKRAADVQGNRVRRAQGDQREEMDRQQRAIAAQEETARKEKEQLQREESDKIRAGQRKGGRRSLLYADEKGVESGLRTTLG